MLAADVLRKPKLSVTGWQNADRSQILPHSISPPCITTVGNLPLHFRRTEFREPEQARSTMHTASSMPKAKMRPADAVSIAFLLGGVIPGQV